MKKYIWIAVALAGGFLAGWLIFGFHDHRNDTSTASASDHIHPEGQVWTCSMHPQIRMDAPGDCPICGMDLIPLRTSDGSQAGDVPDHAMRMSAEAVALANIRTSTVSRREPTKEILLYGVVAPDERSLQSQSAHVGGRIDKLYVDFTGVSVRRGEPLARIYSPELITAQNELLEAAKLRESQPALLVAAREKLKQWKLTDSQIATIEALGVPSTTIEIVSDTSGIVMAKRVSEGDYVPQGGVLFDIASLSRVWVLFDAYEADLAFLKTGDRVEFTLPALAGRKFSGSVSFIDPILDGVTRTAKVRVEVANPDGLIKPRMYATGRVNARLGQYGDRVVIPRSAVLWTGTRSIVYVSLQGYDTPVFSLREVELGPSLENAYVVLSGLEDGEQIVTGGAFVIDASAQLEGKRSMMNDATEGGHEGHAGRSNRDDSAANVAHDGHTGGHSMQPAAAPASDDESGYDMLRVGGSCEMCKERIEKTALGIKEVESAAWNSEDKMLRLSFNPAHTSLAAISRAIAAVGHDTSLDKADDAVYNALPACCKYRK